MQIANITPALLPVKMELLGYVPGTAGRAIAKAHAAECAGTLCPACNSTWLDYAAFVRKLSRQHHRYRAFGTCRACGHIKEI